MSLSQAMQAETFFPQAAHLPFIVGDTDAVLTGSEAVVEGELQTTRQEHFYEETMSMLAVPSTEENELKVAYLLPVTRNLHLLATGVLPYPERTDDAAGNRCHARPPRQPRVRHRQADRLQLRRQEHPLPALQSRRVACCSH